MVIGMAPSVNVKRLRRAQRRERARSTPTSPWSTATPRPRSSPPVGASAKRSYRTAYIQAESSIFQQAVAQGQTVVAAAGDEGSEDCYHFPSSNDTRLQVDDPAGQPWVTGVGGTTLDALGPGADRVGVEPRPVHAARPGAGTRRPGPCRRGNGAPASRARTPRRRTPSPGPSRVPMSSGAGTLSCREVPDVAADADPRTGLAIFCTCVSGGWAQDRRDEHGGSAVGRPGRPGRPGPVDAGGLRQPHALPGAVWREPRLQRRDRREQSARRLAAEQRPAQLPSARTTRPHRATTWPPASAPPSPARS